MIEAQLGEKKLSGAKGASVDRRAHDEAEPRSMRARSGWNFRRCFPSDLPSGAPAGVFAAAAFFCSRSVLKTSETTVDSSKVLPCMVWCGEVHAQQRIPPRVSTEPLPGYKALYSTTVYVVL